MRILFKAVSAASSYFLLIWDWNNENRVCFVFFAGSTNTSTLDIATGKTKQNSSKMWSSQKGPTRLWDLKFIYLFTSFMVSVNHFYYHLHPSPPYPNSFLNLLWNKYRENYINGLLWKCCMEILRWIKYKNG